MYVLDERDEAVPIGVGGGIHIGGRGLARGYMRDAEKTAERFVRRRVAGEPGQCGSTGLETARGGRTGQLHYVGRTDQQVEVARLQDRARRDRNGARRVRRRGGNGGEGWEDERGNKRLVGYVWQRPGEA